MEPGFVIAGRYRLDHHIAVGGMGSVWRGFDLSLERAVAVKLLLRGLHSADKPAERFAREAKALARVRNPGCVEVHDVGQHHDGDEVLRYIVMELVEGESLKDRLDRSGLLAPAEVMTRIAEAADALEAAHGVGIVHRDVKPGNLLIDAGERTRVVDFGISTLTDATRLTQSNAVLGTLPYVSPEQFEGEETTAASDIYALGAVAYECLTGRPPFAGENSKAIIHAHLFVEPEPLPDTVPAAVSRIVLRALAKDPADRWPSCADLAAACRDAATGLPEDTPAAPAPAATAPAVTGAQEEAPAEAREDGPEAPTTAEVDETVLLARRPRRGRRTAVVLAVVAVLALLGGLIAWQQWPRGGELLGTGPTSEGAEEEGTSEPAPASSGDPTPSDSPAESGTPTEDGPATGGAGASGDENGGTDGGGTEGGSDGDGGGSGDGDGGDDDGGSGETEEEPDPPATEGAVPDVTGSSLANAKAEMKDEGFTNVEYRIVFFDGSSPDECEVVDQSPAGGTVTGFTDPITVEYFMGSAC